MREARREGETGVVIAFSPLRLYSIYRSCVGRPFGVCSFVSFVFLFRRGKVYRVRWVSFSRFGLFLGDAEGFIRRLRDDMMWNGCPDSNSPSWDRKLYPLGRLYAQHSTHTRALYVHGDVIKKLKPFQSNPISSSAAAANSS